jgi:DNA helicase HerA-like ATPase
MGREIPNLVFRFEPGYTIDSPLVLQEFSEDNTVVAKNDLSESVSSIFLGKLAEYEHMRKNMWLDTEGAHAVYVMGKRRSGKTYTLGVILEGLASNNWIRRGDQRQAILFVDTMNVFITMPHSVLDVYGETSPQGRELSRWYLPKELFDVLLLYPRGSLPPPEGITKEIALRACDLTAADWASLFEVDTYADPIGQLISEIYEKVALEGYRKTDGTLVGANSNYSIEDMLDCLGDCPQISPPRYEQRTIEAVRRRISALRRLSLFSSAGTDIREIFVPGQISILLLRDLDQSIRALLVGVLVKKIMQQRSVADRYERLAAVQLNRSVSLRDKDSESAQAARLKSTDYMDLARSGLPRGWVIIDEAHNYLPSRGIMASSEPLKKYVNEGRNLGLSIVVATQNPSGLDPAIRRNADVLIIHSMSMRDDVATAEGMVNTFVPDGFTFGRDHITGRVFEQMIRSLPLGYAVLSNDNLSRISVVKIRPRLTVHGGLEY